MNGDKITLQLQEGLAKNYFKGLKQALGGDYTETMYIYNRGNAYIRMFAYPIMTDFEIMVTEALFDKPILQERLPDDNPDLIHIYIVYQGHSTQSYNNQKQYIEAGTSSGVFIYNGLFPVVTEYPANVAFNFITLKLNKSVFLKLLPNANLLLNTLFTGNSPIAYHIALPHELDAIIRDIIHYEKTNMGRIPMVMAKGLELFSKLVMSVIKLSDKDELNGLHQDDYRRILAVKDRLLSKIEGNILSEDIAKEFGLSVSKLKRDFKTMFNTSLYQFYAHAKMDEAYRRLKTGKFTVMEVGYDLGYSSIPNFSKMFKKIKGINPKDVIPL